MNSDKAQQRRQYFRLVFPRQGRLQLKTNSGQSFPIVDMSEKGLRLDFDASQSLRNHQVVSGEICFHDGHRSKVAGKVIRKDSRGSAIMLDLGVETRDMIHEQVHVMRNYPMFLEEKFQQSQLRMDN